MIRYPYPVNFSPADPITADDLERLTAAFLKSYAGWNRVEVLSANVFNAFFPEPPTICDIRPLHGFTVFGIPVVENPEVPDGFAALVGPDGVQMLDLRPPWLDRETEATRVRFKLLRAWAVVHCPTTCPLEWFEEFLGKPRGEIPKGIV